MKKNILTALFIGLFILGVNFSFGAEKNTLHPAQFWHKVKDK